MVSQYMYTQNEYGHKYVPAQYETDASGNTVLVTTDETLSFGANLLPRIQTVHDIALDEPLYELSLPTPYGTETATSGGKYEFAYGTPVYCARGFGGYKFWMVAAPYPTQAVGPLVPNSASKHENPCILASNDGENWVVPTGLTNPIATSIGLADTNSYYADPYIAFNSDYSKLYVTFMWTNQSGTNKSSLLVTESSDGVTWSTPVSIYDSTSTTFTANSPSMFWNGNGWTCICIDTRDGTGTYTPKVMTTSEATPYSGWSAWADSTWTHPLSRGWWHAHFVPVDGGIIGMACDNSSAGGAAWTLQSWDGGSNFSVYPFSAWKASSAGGTWYRPSLCVCSDGVNQTLLGFFSRIAPLQQAGFYVQKARLASGPTSPAAYNAVLSSMVAGQTVQASGVLAAWDSFIRADNAAALGTSDGTHVWSNDTGTFGISTNRAYNSTAAGGNSIVSINPGLQSYEYIVEILTAGTDCLLCFNMVDASNRYRFGLSSGAVKFQKIVSGSVTVNLDPTIDISDGDFLGVRVQGKYITLYHNGRPIDTYYDSSVIAGTKVGLQAATSTSYFGQMMVKPL